MTDSGDFLNEPFKYGPEYYEGLELGWKMATEQVSKECLVLAKGLVVALKKEKIPEETIKSVEFVMISLGEYISQMKMSDSAVKQ